MIRFIYLFVLINVLLVEPSSIRNTNHQNEFTSFIKSKSNLAKESDNGVKIVNREPFIVQLETHQGTEKFKNDEEKEKKVKPKKNLLKKRYHNMKAFRKKGRTKREADLTGAFEKTRREINNMSTRKENQHRILIDPKKLHKPFWETRHVNLTPKSKQHEIDYSKESIFDEEKSEKKLSREKVRHKPIIKHLKKNIQRPAHYTSTYSSDALNALLHPSTSKLDKGSAKYTEKDLKQSMERAEDKINYMKRILRMNDFDSAPEINRKSRKIETDNKAANRLAKMFLALSALNHSKQKSKLKSDESKSWESEEEAQDDNSIKSFNEERYKIKKWIEHMKSKRSSKTCTCTEGSEEHDMFPLERTLASENGDDSLEECRRKIAGTKNPSLRRKLERFENQKYKNCKSCDDDLDKIKALTTRGSRKLELPLDDLEAYRSRAKQILQNAEEILDKLNKQEDEKRYSNPALLMDRVKELTSRIHGDPRNSENDLIKMIQKNMDLSPLFRLHDENEKKDLSKSIKSYFVDPYEKARALTEESARKLSAYLLKNLALLGNDDKTKGEGESKIVGEKEEMPQIHQAQDSWDKSLPSTGDELSKRNGDELNAERGLLHPIIDSSEPTTLPYKLDESDVRLAPPPHQKIKELLTAQYVQPKESNEDVEKVRDTAATEKTENADDVKVAMDWLRSNLEEDTSQIAAQDNGNLQSDEKIKTLLENQEVSSKEKHVEQSNPDEKTFDLLQKDQAERYFTSEKNEESTSKNVPEREPNVRILEDENVLGDSEPLGKTENNLAGDNKVEQKLEVTENTDLVGIKKEVNSKMSESEKEAADIEMKYKEDNLPSTPAGTDKLEKRFETTLESEEIKTESNNQDYKKEKEEVNKKEKKQKMEVEEDGFLGMNEAQNFKDQNLKEKAVDLDDEISQSKLLETNKNPLENVEGSSHEIQVFHAKGSLGEEPKGENLLGVMEDQKETDQNLASLRMNDELIEPKKPEDLSDIDKVSEEKNLEKAADIVSVQQSNEEFPSEKQIDQSSEEKVNNDGLQETGEIVMKNGRKKDEKEVNEEGDTSQDMIPEELNRNENDVLASEHLKPKEEQEQEAKNHNQQSSFTSQEKDEQDHLGMHKKDTSTSEEDTNNLGTDNKEKNASSVKNSKENESESDEETGNDKETVELQGLRGENLKAVGDGKIKSDSTEKQSLSSYEENIPPENPISEGTKDTLFSEKDSESGNTKPKEEILGTQERGSDEAHPTGEMLESQETDGTTGRKELLGSQERKADEPEGRDGTLDSREREADELEGTEELLGSQEKATDEPEGKEEVLGSPERGTERTEGREELLGSQERGADEPERREEILGSQERGAEGTEGREELLDSQERATVEPEEREGILGSQERGTEETEGREELLGSQERTTVEPGGREGILDSQERETDEPEEREEILGSQERTTVEPEGREGTLDFPESGADEPERREEILGSQERGRDEPEEREGILGSQERGTEGTEGREELLGSPERSTIEPEGRNGILDSQERRTDEPEEREGILGSQERTTDEPERREEVLGSQERGSDDTGRSKGKMGSEETETDRTEPMEEILGSQERGADETQQTGEILESHGRTDGRGRREEILDSQEFYDIGETRESLGSQGGIGSAEEGRTLQEKNGFATLATDGFGSREYVEEKNDWLIPNGFQSLESDDYENTETAQSGKDWIHPKSEDIVQSDRQGNEANQNNSEEMGRLGDESERKDSPISNEAEGEMSEQKDEIVELEKPEEESRETTFEKKSGEEESRQTTFEKKSGEEESRETTFEKKSDEEDEILKKNLNEEIEDYESPNEGKGINDNLDHKGKIIKVIDEEKKDILKEIDNLMNKNAEVKEKEWATHPFEDKMSNEFKYYDPSGEESSPQDSQASQFLRQPFKYGGSPKEENLQRLDSASKTKNLKVPQEIEKIMKDLNDGKEKDDIDSIRNLDPEKIDKFIDKIDEAKKEEEEESVDCKKECACADEIELKSRRTGRYEIAKDFLRWLKDMKMNRVLSDD